MSGPRSISAWAVWHPEYEWGLDSPQLYPSKAIAIKKLTAGGVWPLQHGWQLYRVTVTANVSAAPVLSSQERL